MLLLYRHLSFRSESDQYHLHSTMLLLYRADSLPDCLWGSQFTFHYASTLSTITAAEDIVTPEFTFHYASTLSGTVPEDRERDCEFTFHYASTLSAIAELKTVMEKNLHSTMLLLYLWSWWRMWKKSSRFTFHYASTLSRCIRLRLHRDIYLHSTMLLLYQEIFRPPDCRSVIYIPLCFYFIWTGIPDILFTDCHLHSTMLLLYPNLLLRIAMTATFTFHYASTLSHRETCCLFSRLLFTFHYASTLSASTSDVP